VRNVARSFGRSDKIEIVINSLNARRVLQPSLLIAPIWQVWPLQERICMRDQLRREFIGCRISQLHKEFLISVLV